ncbi:MAG: RNA-binding transcriptional accessory protein [Ectothiorhodospiraceae bacterium]|nr:RNA-binding transcriptional accessory protein [Ectothiorhodospiraceae bacterium]
MSEQLIQRLSGELRIHPRQATAAIELLDGGATVPFIARYRKEATQGLDDGQLRQLEERLGYLRELDERRRTVLDAIQEQGKLTGELRTAILAADTKQRLEDLYLPYKKKRRTRGQIAREAGLEPLARQLLENPALDPESTARDYVNPKAEIPDATAALEGAKHLLAEEFAEDAELVGALRQHAWEHGVLHSELVDGMQEAGAKFSDYFTYQERLKAIPSHRALALFRGRKERVLRLTLVVDGDARTPGPCEQKIATRFGISHQGRPADDWLAALVRFAWRIKIFTRLETDLLGQLREAAETEAIQVFAHNLHDLLLAAPAGNRCVLGLDPGIRTGCKVAVVDGTGKLLETATVYPLPPRNAWRETIAELAALATRHRVELVAIGNGTGSREIERLVKELVQQHPQLKLTQVMVSEAGASVYSASELAAAEFPDLDVSLRGAVSIARRLQDPLAELVKIDPKSIGVGQYQHDVSQVQLARSLETVVEDCVNAVGVDLNTASAALLARVSGLSATLAEKVVEYRNTHGAFRSREALKKVPRLGDKTFEQAAGFLRIRDGEQPLDASAVHPEAYPLVERILQRNGRKLQQVIGDRAFLRALNAADYTDTGFGEPTVRDILAELEKPGRDPRPEFRTAAFKEGVEKVSDLQPGMILEGVVTNVTNFGAFVDIGVHQDGLVHISAMSEKFIRDPREVSRSGDVVKVKVMEVDLRRQRIALSMRLQDPLPDAEGGGRRPGKPQRQETTPRVRNQRGGQKEQPGAQGALAQALLQAKKH